MTRPIKHSRITSHVLSGFQQTVRIQLILNSVKDILWGLGLHRFIFKLIFQSRFPQFWGIGDRPIPTCEADLIHQSYLPQLKSKNQYCPLFALL